MYDRRSCHHPIRFLLCQACSILHFVWQQIIAAMVHCWSLSMRVPLCHFVITPICICSLYFMHYGYCLTETDTERYHAKNWKRKGERKRKKNVHSFIHSLVQTKWLVLVIKSEAYPSFNELLRFSFRFASFLPVLLLLMALFMVSVSRSLSRFHSLALIIIFSG